MNKRELFDARVHAMACATLSNADQRERSEYWLTNKMIEAAIENVQAVDAALAEIPHAEEPTPAPPTPLAWRPMSEIAEATERIAVAYMQDDKPWPHLTTSGYLAAGEDLGWLQLPPLPASKL
jgi:hypothetical protein